MKMKRIATTLIVVSALAGVARTAKAQIEPYLGQIIIVPYNFAPIGWQFCQGQLLPIGPNSALFSLLGTTFGGDGVRTFALPDLRGRAPIGWGQGPGLSPIILGESAGAETTTLTIAQLPAHSHPLMASTLEAAVVSPTGSVLGSKARVPLYSGVSDLTPMSGASVGETGGNEPFPIRNPYLGLSYIIATQGVYPTRG
jgi:microcystin-dependent protein